MPKGKTPSLIGSSLGRPVAAVAGKLCYCSRCDASIMMDEKCYDVPQPSKSFSRPRRFCPVCFEAVLEQTRRDVAELKDL